MVEKLKSRIIQWYGWRPDVPDHRDYRLTAPVGQLPQSVDLTSQMPPVMDQGNLGSCVANATAACLQFDRQKQKLSPYPLSRLLIYYETRRIEGTIKEDAGCEIRDAIKVLAKIGSCDEKFWPYKIAKFATKPAATAYKHADTQAIKYSRVDQTEQGIKSALASGFPVAFGFAVYQSFESNEVAQTGNVPMPGPIEQMLGGHAVALVGYGTDGRYIVRNSWGKGWGRAGYFTMPAEYVLNNNLCDDFWVVQSVG